MFGGDRHGTHGRRVWDGADARDFAGWLIALMVWLLPGAEWARVSIVIILTYLIGISGFNHIIAGVHYHVFFGGHQINFPGTYMPQFFFPTLLGNVIGGLAVVAALGHAQVVGGKEEQGKAKG
jgi:formate/nitrite transporter FocA (FNT family)